MSSATPTAALDLLDPADFPDRDALVAFLVNQCGWSSKKLGAIFGRSDRQVRRIAREAREAGRPARRMGAFDEPTPADPAGPGPRYPRRIPATILTTADTEAMLRDYALDPYISAEDRELAREWIVDITARGGVVVSN